MAGLCPTPRPVLGWIRVRRGGQSDSNLTADGVNTYTYDAEGNLVQVNSGATAKYTYNALNQRVRIDQGGMAREFVFNLNGQRTSIWDGNSGNQIQGQVYWGAMPVEFYAGGSAHFQHQDWLGTERARTTYNGSVEGTFASLPFGDGYSFSGNDDDPYHYATLDKDYYGGSDSQTDHAQFRQYSDAEGRWMSPDPYDGSYDFSNPQSFNRYSYVLNNPLSFTDPMGLVTNGAYCGDNCPSDNDGFFGIFVDIGDALADLFRFGGPSFHGSLKPRPAGTGNPDWANADGSFGESLGIGYQIPTGRWGIAQALGLPDAGCEFGACGGGPSAFGPGTVALGGTATIACIALEPCGVFEGIGFGIALAGTAIGVGDIIHTMASSQEKSLLNWVADSFCVDRKALGQLIHEEKQGRQKGKKSDLTLEEIKELARLLPKIAGCTPTAR